MFTRHNNTGARLSRPIFDVKTKRVRNVFHRENEQIDFLHLRFVPYGPRLTGSFCANTRRVRSRRPLIHTTLVIRRKPHSARLKNTARTALAVFTSEELLGANNTRSALDHGPGSAVSDLIFVLFGVVEEVRFDSRIFRMTKRVILDRPPRVAGQPRNVPANSGERFRHVEYFRARETAGYRGRISVAGKHFDRTSKSKSLTESRSADIGRTKFVS